MQRTSVFIYFSAIALLAAVVSQFFGWSAARSWLLLAWAVLLLPTVVSLFSHPMRKPAWGLFVGFWAVVAVLFLIVIQVLNLWAVLRSPAYGEWAAWPLAVIGVWMLVASGSGFGAERFPVIVDVLGLLSGAAFLAISITNWAAPDLMKGAGVVAAVAYCLWAVALGWVVWGMQRPTHRFRGIAIQHGT